jgi:hypothetical protein
MSMTDEEALMTLGVITTAARDKTGHTRQYAADAMGINYRTLGGLERAEGKTPKGPLASTLRAVEDFYGWREGSMREFWENRRTYKFGSVTEEDFLPPAPTGMLEAAHLTDQQLMNELSFRFLMRDRRGSDHD